MIIAFIVYVSHFFYFSGNAKGYYFLDAFYLGASLAVYPLYHIYVRLLIIDKAFNLKSHGKYLIIPTLIFLLYVPYHIIMSPEQHAEFIKGVVSGYRPAAGIEKYFFVVYRLSQLLFILQIIFYLWMNFRILWRNTLLLQDYYSNTEDKKIGWVQFFNFALAITSIAGITASIIGRAAFTENEWYLFFPSLVFSTMLFAIGLLGNKQNSIGIGEDSGTDSDETEKKVSLEKNEDDRTTEMPNFRELKNSLETLFEKDLVFKDANLKIWDLCAMLGTNRTYLSQCINNEYGQNFSNFVNSYRVEHVKKMIVSNPDISIAELLQDSGFGSANSLYRAFKGFEGLGLSDFKKAQKAQSRSINPY